MKALIINDNQDDRFLLKQKIKSFMIVDEAFDGLDGLNKIRKGYDVIFLDVIMPEMNGFEVLEKLNSRDKRKIIVMSGFDDTGENLVRLAQFGAIHVLSITAPLFEIRHELVKMGVLTEKEDLSFD